MESKEPYTTTTAPFSPPPVYEKATFGARLQEFMNTFWVYEIMASLVSLAMLVPFLVFSITTMVGISTYGITLGV
jgi:hypothetical protein